MMNLVIDIGNTLVKYAVFSGNEIIELKKIEIENEELIKNLLSEYKIKSIIISSVRKERDWNFNIRTIVLSEKTKLPITLQYKTPQTLGNDRIANVVAVNSLYKNKNILVIDAGTCITFDFIDNNSCYHGGRISPGINMRYKSLNEFTSNLPKLSITKDFTLFGDNTNSSIITGVQMGVISEIEGFISDLKKEKEDLIVILTGGDAFFFEKYLKNGIFADPNLVLKGLNEILKYNE